MWSANQLKVNGVDYAKIFGMDLPAIRRANLLQLFSDYVAGRMADSPAEQISGLDREFAALIQVHNTYFSGMKSGSRTIGHKLARQVEVLCKKTSGWMDEPRQAVKAAGLENFLRLAEQAYLGAPKSRKLLVKAMRDAINEPQRDAKSGATKQLVQEVR